MPNLSISLIIGMNEKQVAVACILSSSSIHLMRMLVYNVHSIGMYLSCQVTVLSLLFGYQLTKA